MRYVVGIDVGGTKIAACLMDEEGKMPGRATFPTLASEGPKAVIGRIKQSFFEVLKQGQIEQNQVAALGIGMPGPLDTKKGIVKNTPNLPGWIDIPLLQILKSEINLPMVLENDANAAALGENLYGAGKGIDNFVYITISTGIGGGVVLNGRLFKGQDGNAAEIGHMTINFDGPRCGCGNQGCWEAYASGTALARFAREKIAAGEATKIKELAGEENIKAEHVFAAAKKGDKFALELIEKEGFYLGVGLANVVNAYNPKRIAIGGGLTHEWNMFYDRMMQVMRERALGASIEGLEVVKAALSKDVGVIGAAAVAWSIC
ncbi:MAG: glucokinase [Thermoanaerobacteraceae bacterium]|nr:ROK family protein [Biomaibacter acetigenes]MDK2878146.1 glucokinase [Thermoanaerobacteraceae bacterium]MDN5301711.1 glucokinase [Thermoanaerobacteraceae bacterium]MDN5313354.1 glucokinase [Thermoanaerobacteraceae bacterium]